MPSNHKILTIILPERFIPIFNNFVDILDNDKEFKKAVFSKKTKHGLRDKRVKKNKMVSAKVRYAISMFVINYKKQALQSKESELFGKQAESINKVEVQNDNA